MVGGWVGPTVIIGLVSVQLKLKLDLPTGTELGKIHKKTQIELCHALLRLS